MLYRPQLSEIKFVAAIVTESVYANALPHAIEAERTIIEETVLQVHWNRRRAAEQLGVSYKTLLNKIKECGIGRK